jgi:hypothetical protein
MTWALARLKKAKRRHITVFGMMHHNLIEHYSGQTQLIPDTLQKTGNLFLISL